MKHNSAQLRTCRPEDGRPAKHVQGDDRYGFNPYQSEKTVGQAYNEATEWEWIVSFNPDAKDLVSPRYTAADIDPLLPEYRLQLDEITDHVPAHRTLAGLWDLENWGEGEDFRAQFLRQMIAELALLPNTLLAKTIVRLYGESALDVTREGRIRLRGIDWMEVHGALWHSNYRWWVERKIRRAELMATGC